MKTLNRLFIFVLLFYVVNIYADTCNYSELSTINKDVSKVKIDYEIISNKITVDIQPEDVYEGEIGGHDEEDKISSYESFKDTIKITLYNMTNNFYFIQTDDKTDEKKAVYYSDTIEGKYIIETDEISDYKTYTFEIYSNLDTCDTTHIKTLTFIKPKLNPNYNYQICQDNPLIPVCAKYITKDTGVLDSELQEYINKFLNSTNEETEEVKKVNSKSKIIAFIKNNLIYFITGTVVIVSGITVIIIISKKRSKI